jgi:hypothetical protein
LEKKMIATNHKRSVGIFSSHQAAENALTELRDDGFAMSQVSVIAQNAERLEQSSQIGATQVQDLTDANQSEEGAKTGAATGGVLGGVTGLLVGLGTLAIPGVGPVMLAGATATAIATTLTGGAIGAAAGSLVGGLIGLGIPEERAQVYHDHVVRGNYLVIVDGTDADILRAETILKRRGIREWEVYTAPEIGEFVDPPLRR